LGFSCLPQIGSSSSIFRASLFRLNALSFYLAKDSERNISERVKLLDVYPVCMLRSREKEEAKQVLMLASIVLAKCEVSLNE
jgi:hypothetical protein